MRFVFYTHSLVSDWNHGNAHFLRGVMRELGRRGHEALALEPAHGWSRGHLLAEQGPAAIARFGQDFPDLLSATYDADFDHEAALDRADVVIVHEWTDPGLVACIGRIRARNRRIRLLFHDTHHRAVSAGDELARLDLEHYDGVLAFGEALREHYLHAGWGRSVHVWHEAADVSLFHPIEGVEPSGDLIWIGNWGDDERTAELEAYLVGPAERLHLEATIRGVRYPIEAQRRLRRAGIRYGGWIANADVPRALAQHRVTVHVPRRPYVEALPGIPTIRVFEALAAGIPLISAPWSDSEGLFRIGEDFLMVSSGAEMERRLRDVLSDSVMRQSLSRSGRERILAHHTCGHRVEQLLCIVAGLKESLLAYETGR